MLNSKRLMEKRSDVLYSSSFEWVVTIHCLAALDLVASVVQQIDCLII